MAHVDMTPAVAGEVAGAPRRRPVLGSIELALKWVVEIPAAILVVTEVVILFAGVVSRCWARRSHSAAASTCG
jgi:hypothetical protein